MDHRFEGRAAIVTGAGSGLGAAVARRLAAEGAGVACLDVSVEGAEKTAAAVAEAGGRAAAIVCDVRDDASVGEAVERAVAEVGDPDVVCNVAGVLRMSHTADTPLDLWELVVGVNLTGTFLVCRETLPLVERTGGNIVNVASSAGIRAFAYAAAYSASKAGVIQLTKSLAEEYKARGVRINAVAPAGMATPMVRQLDVPDGVDMRLLLKHSSPMGESTPDEVAGVVAFLASPEARFMTGSIVVVDGGVTV